MRPERCRIPRHCFRYAKHPRTPFSARSGKRLSSLHPPSVRQKSVHEERFIFEIRSFMNAKKDTGEAEMPMV